jgi:glycosyltransferase involved in cell wall biosynthesis
MVPITVVIPTLDEAGRIAACIASARWAGEVIVADGGSSDATVEVARAVGATVLERCGPTIAAQRNQAIAGARYEWVLALDADELVSPELATELATVAAAPAHAAYRIRRQNFYLGRELTRGHWGHDWIVRFFPRERRYLEQRVHESLEPVADVGTLRGTILHEPYRDLPHHVSKMMRYGEWGAQDLFDRGRRASLSDLLVRPAWRFVKTWILQGSILDGRYGVINAGLSASASFYKYAYLWDLEQRQRTLQRKRTA